MLRGIEMLGCTCSGLLAVRKGLAVHVPETQRRSSIRVFRLASSTLVWAPRPGPVARWKPGPHEAGASMPSTQAPERSCPSFAPLRRSSDHQNLYGDLLGGMRGERLKDTCANGPIMRSSLKAGSLTLAVVAGGATILLGSTLVALGQQSSELLRLQVVHLRPEPKIVSCRTIGTSRSNFTA
jgi:hypothetical protein